MQKIKLRRRETVHNTKKFFSGLNQKEREAVVFFHRPILTQAQPNYFFRAQKFLSHSKIFPNYTTKKIPPQKLPSGGDIFFTINKIGVISDYFFLKRLKKFAKKFLKLAKNPATAGSMNGK